MAEAGNAGGLLGTLYIRFTAQTDELNKKVDDSEKKVTKATDKMGKSAIQLGGILKALGLAWGINEVVSFMKETIHAADEVKKFASELGLAIDRVAGLKFAADKANVGDTFQQGMRKFAAGFREAQVEGSEMAHLFNDLGIDVKKGMDSAFDSVADQLQNMENGVEKMGLSQEFFGTRNAKFVNLFTQGSAGIRREVQELARITGMSYEEAAEKSEAFNDSITTLKYAFRGLAMAVATEILPPITKFMSFVAEGVPTLKAWFKEVGRGFEEAGGVETWEEIKALLSSTWDLLKIGLGFFGELFKGLTGTTSVAKGLGVVLATLLDTQLDLFKYALAGIKAVGWGMAGLLEVLMKTGRWIAEKLVVAFEFWANAGIRSINFLIQGFNSMADKLPDWIKNQLGITGGKVVKPIELFSLGKPNGLDDWIDIVSDVRKDLQGQLSLDFTETAKVVKKGNEEVTESIKAGAKEVRDAFSAERAKKAHEDLDKLVGTDDAVGGRGFRKQMNELAPFGAKGGFGLEGMGEAMQLQNEASQIEETLKEIERLRNEHINISDEQEKRLTELQRAEGDKRKAIQVAMLHMQLQTAESMFGDMADVTKAWAGEQSGIYKAMFAASKAFAIADATVKIAQGIAAAAANVWPLNLFAMASVVAATASIVSSIQAVQLEFGGERATGGPVSSDKAFLVGERGPEMFVPSRNGSIIPNNRLGGGAPKIIVNNFTDAKPEIQTRQEGNEQVIEVLVKKVEDRIGSNVRDGRGNLNKAMTDSFNLRRGQGNG